MKVQARIALDGGSVYAVEVDPDELKAQLSDENSRFLEFTDPAGFATAIPREKVLMVQYGPGIPSPEAQAAQQQAQMQQAQQQFAQMQQQYQQFQQQPSFGEKAKAKLQQFQDQFMIPQQQFQNQSMPPQQQFPPQQPGQNPMQW